MSKKSEFIKYVEELIDATKSTPVEMNGDAQAYWEALKGKPDEEKPMFTDNGKLILSYLKENVDVDSWKAKDIADAIMVSSRTVSGAMRKLCNDGFVEKLGQDPVIYTLTEKGKEINID